MDTRISADLRHQCRNSPRYDFLRIRLAGIDHVVDARAPTEVWPGHFGQHLRVGFGGCYPGDVPIRIRTERLIVEVETELAQLPQLIGDVLSGVGNGPV